MSLSLMKVNSRCKSVATKTDKSWEHSEQVTSNLKKEYDSEQVACNSKRMQIKVNLKKVQIKV